MGNKAMEALASGMEDTLRFLLAELVDKPDASDVSHLISAGGMIVLTAEVAGDEVGKVLGRNGRNAQALRTLLEAIAAKNKTRVVLEISERGKRKGRK